MLRFFEKGINHVQPHATNDENGLGHEDTKARRFTKTSLGVPPCLRALVAIFRRED